MKYTAICVFMMSLMIGGVAAFQFANMSTEPTSNDGSPIRPGPALLILSLALFAGAVAMWFFGGKGFSRAKFCFVPADTVPKKESDKV